MRRLTRSLNMPLEFIFVFVLVKYGIKNNLSNFAKKKTVFRVFRVFRFLVLTVFWVYLGQNHDKRIPTVGYIRGLRVRGQLCWICTVPVADLCWFVLILRGHSQRQYIANSSDSFIWILTKMDSKSHNFLIFTGIYINQTIFGPSLGPIRFGSQNLIHFAYSFENFTR